MHLATLPILALLAGSPASTSPPPVPHPAVPAPSADCPGYTEGLDGEAQLQAALAEARSTGRRVLLVFGANYCPWCRALCELWFRPDISLAAEKGFVVARIDVGHGERNANLVQRLGLRNPSIPHLVVLDANEKLLVSQPTNVFEEKTGRVAHVPELVLEFLAAWTGPPAPPPAK